MTFGGRIRKQYEVQSELKWFKPQKDSQGMIFAGLSFNVSISVNPRMSWASGQEVTIQSTWKTHCNLQLSKRFYIRQVFCLTVTSKPLCMSCTVFLVVWMCLAFDQIVMLSHRSSAVGRRTLDTNVATCRTWLQKMFPNNLQRRGSKKDWVEMRKSKNVWNTEVDKQLWPSRSAAHTSLHKHRAFKQQLAVKAHSWFLAEKPCEQKSPCLL